MYGFILISMKRQIIKMSTKWKIIFFIALLKLIIHLIISTNYELHRDAYLYLALSDHLAFGYVSVPPSIAIFGKLITSLIGDSEFAVRLLPALIGTASIFLLGLIVKELNGKKTAIIIACLAYLLSPAYLRTASLFQPVIFNQFYWLLSGYVIIRLIKTYKGYHWIILFIIWGLAFLNKYSISFFMLGFFISLLLTKHRILYRSKYFIMGAIIGLLIIMPNLLWQYNHNWPVIHHMQKLHENQLVHVKSSDFMMDQFIMNIHAIWIWLLGLIAFLFFHQEKQYRLLALIYLFTLLILLLARGKSYYTLGLYPLLFAMGGYTTEKYLINRLYFLRYFFLAFLFTGIPLIPYGLPILKVEKMEQYGQITAHWFNNMVLRWEDGKIHKLPQDFADMVGWSELGNLVIGTFQKLTPEEQAQCAIYAENYGQAGAINYYGKDFGLPEPVSFSDNFLLWAPENISAHTLIYVNYEPEDMGQLFNEYRVIDTISNPYFRENGLKVYLCSQPKETFNSYYTSKVKALKQKHNF